MHLTLRSAFELLALLGALSSIGFYFLSLCGIVRFLKACRQKAACAQPTHHPPVSILKPLKGIDPQLWEALCSHCTQDYPDYELILGASDPNDPAIELVHKLQQQYRDQRIEVVICPRDMGANRKVSALAQMLDSARHEILLVNDSDIRVERDYLRRVVEPLHDPSTGMVTCLYRGVAAPTLGSRLEALGISTDFVPGVLSAHLLEGGLRFGLGSTMVFRRADLKAMGGFEALADYLADDYELGKRIAALARRVHLSDVVVETFLPAYSPRAFFNHQLRWARSVRGSRPWGYIGLLLTFGIPFAILTLVAAPSALWAWGLFGVTVIARLAVAFTSGMAVLGDRQLLCNLYLLPLRDLIAPVVWLLGLVGNRIHWRGEVFYLQKGRLVRNRESRVQRPSTPSLKN